MDQVDIETINLQARKAKDLFNEGKHNEAESMMEGVMKQALDFYKDELAIEMAEFYYMYGTILVLKLSEQQDVFGQRAREAEQNVLGEETEESINSNEVEQINDGEVEEENKAQEVIKKENVEDLDDFKVAWENLEVARVILEKQIQQQEATDNKETKYIKNLAKVLIKLAELDQWRDRFEEAEENFTKALTLRLKVEDSESSRDVAEIYFFLGNVTLYNYKEGKEAEAIQQYLKAIQILENHLSSITKTEKKIIILQEQYNRDHLKQTLLDTDEIQELKQVMSMVYDKIEDTQIALKEIQTEEWKKARDEMFKKVQIIEEQQVQQQQFTQQPFVEERKIIQLGNFGNARKKVEQQQEQKQTLIEEKQIAQKENIIDNNNQIIEEQQFNNTSIIQKQQQSNQNNQIAEELVKEQQQEIDDQEENLKKVKID